MLRPGLFSSFLLQNSDSPEPDDEDDASEIDSAEVPTFQINIASFLETLQILGSVDLANRAAKVEQDGYRSTTRNYRPEAFSNQALGIAGTCCLLYPEANDPFSITIEEGGVKTTASLTTYRPDMPDSIPFDRDQIVFRIILPSRHLLDALSEVATMAPGKLAITVLTKAPWLVLSGRSGDLGTSNYDFRRGRDLIETFHVEEEWTQTYKFDLIKAAIEALRISSKVSIRGDAQGVLNMQFMVGIEGDDNSFIDFTFVPFASYDADDSSDDEYEEDEDENEDS